MISFNGRRLYFGWKSKPMFLRITLFFIFLMFFSLAQGQTTEYSGVVKLKRDKNPLPGVSVLLKGTRIGTQTDFDGNFTINVPDSIHVLSFSYLGVKPLEYRLKEKRFLEIFLKEDCTVCFFDAQQIGFFVQSGVLNNPVGGQFNLSSPFIFGRPTLKGGIGYQTNLKDNRFLNANINLEHLIVDCGFNLDISTSLRQLEFDNTFESTSHSIEAIIHTRGVMTHVGFGNIRYVDDSKLVNSNGPLIGVGTWTGPPFYATISAKTSIFNSISEYQGEIKRSFKGFSAFLKYYKVGDFNEISLGVGIEFTYHLKKREN